MRRTLALLRGLKKSRLGWLLVCLHAVWFFLAIANMSPLSSVSGAFFGVGGGSDEALLAGRPFHFHYESLLLKALVLADLPAMFATLPLSLAVAMLSLPLHIDLYAGSYLDAGILLLCASGEWLLVGYWIDRRLARSIWGSRLPQQIYRALGADQDSDR